MNLHSLAISIKANKMKNYLISPFLSETILNCSLISQTVIAIFIENEVFRKNYLVYEMISLEGLFTQ